MQPFKNFAENIANVISAPGNLNANAVFQVFSEMRFQQITTKIIYEIQIELSNCSSDIEEDKISCRNLNYSVILSPFSISDASAKNVGFSKTEISICAEDHLFSFYLLSIGSMLCSISFSIYESKEKEFIDLSPVQLLASRQCQKET